MGAGAASSIGKAVFTSPSATGTATTSVVKADRPPQARPLTGRKAASTPSIPEATTYKPLTESFEQTVSADNLSSQASEAGDPRQAAASMTEAGGRENLAAEAVAACVLSSVPVNSLNTGIFGRGLTTNSVSSLVRLAMSSNFPSGLLNQVY